METLTTYSLDRIAVGLVLVRNSDGQRIGRATRYFGNKTWTASRPQGTEDDCRRVSQGFRTVATAAAWIAKGAK